MSGSDANRSRCVPGCLTPGGEPHYCTVANHVCGPECAPGWRLRDIIEFGAVFGTAATDAVLAWDREHRKRPDGATVLYAPQAEGITYG